MKNHHDHLKVEFSISYVGLSEVIRHQPANLPAFHQGHPPPEASVALSNVGATACQYEAWKGRDFVWISGSVRLSENSGMGLMGLPGTPSFLAHFWEEMMMNRGFLQYFCFIVHSHGGYEESWLVVSDIYSGTFRPF